MKIAFTLDAYDHDAVIFAAPEQMLFRTDGDAVVTCSGCLIFLDCIGWSGGHAASSAGICRKLARLS